MYQNEIERLIFHLKYREKIERKVVKHWSHNFPNKLYVLNLRTIPDTYTRAGKRSKMSKRGFLVGVKCPQS